MKDLFAELAEITVPCAECGKQFRFWVTLDRKPEGIRVNGEPYCWACVEKGAKNAEEKICKQN